MLSREIEKSADYRNGRTSGRHHILQDPLWGANLTKMLSGIMTEDRPRTKLYWLGYLEGLIEVLQNNERND